MSAARNRKGFTLTELLVIVAVILILMSLLVVCVGGLYTYAMQLKCQHRMEQIWTACVMYSTEHRGLLPAAWDFQNNRPWYETLIATKHIDRRDALACPSSDLATTTGSGEPGAAPSLLLDDVPAVQSAIKDALLYLQSMQDPSDGRWPGFWGAGAWYRVTTAMTGLAVLAYTGNGITVDDDEFGDTLTNGIRYLMNKAYTSLDPGGFGQLDGAYNEHKAAHYNYIQGIGVLALCDALRMNPDLELTLPGSGGEAVKLQDMAQQTFSNLVNVQLAYDHGGFAYKSWWYWWIDGHDPSQAGDTSISGWCWQAIHMARECGLDPAPKTWDTIDTYHSNYLGFLVPDNGTLGGGIYYPQSPYWFHRNGLDGSASWSGGERLMTSISLADRLIAGYELDEAAGARTIEGDGYAQYQWLTAEDKHELNVKGEDGDPDFYFLYYMTMAMNVLRGSEWNDWITLVADEFIEHWQTKTPEAEKGMFPGLGCYGPDPLNLYPTALAAMILEMCIADAITDARWGGRAVSAPGQYSFGYNKLIADEDYRYRKPSGDTIVLMDYLRSGIDAEDGPELIAPRHGGKANVLFGDSHVEALTVKDLTELNPEGKLRIKEHLLSLEPGPARLPDEEEPQE